MCVMGWYKKGNPDEKKEGILSAKNCGTKSPQESAKQEPDKNQKREEVPAGTK